jgi:transposase
MCVELTVSLLLAFKLKQSKRGSFGVEKAYKSVMPPSKEISFEEKVRMQHLFHLEITAKDISKKLGRHPASICKHIAVFKSLPPDELPPPPIKRSGRKRLSNDRLDNRLRHYVQQFPFNTAKELKNEVAGWENMLVCYIQKTLQKRLGLPARKPAKKPLLTHQMKMKRLATAKKYLNWSEKQWMDVMFSDESTFRIVNSRSVTVRRAKASRYKSKFTISTVKHAASVIFWGFYSGKVGREGLYFLPKNKTMNGERYKGVMEERLIPFMNFHRAKTFMQDGAPCHRSKMVMEVLKKEKFSILNWPGNSPDLNPIKNCWSHIKRKLKEDHTITSVPKMMQAIKKMWVRDMTRDYFKELSASMPRTLQMVIDQKGEMTKY